MRKHTPGPWFIKRRKNWDHLAIYHIESGKLFPDEKSRPEIATVYGENFKQRIAEHADPSDKAARHLHIVNVQPMPSYTIGKTENMEEAEANARLIVTSPKLFELVKELAIYFERNEIGYTAMREKCLKLIDEVERIKK